ncbi:hypothetical protein [Bosea sp. TAF32]|uniref:hypothetical protein n=1 Tax=Bosea sp. TAF32 TaxID=3237482 RepID=UPI003F907AF6
MSGVERAAKLYDVSSASGCRDIAPGNEHDLPDALALVELALRCPEAAKDRFPAFRLTRLVGSRLDLDERDIERFSDLIRVEAVLDRDDAPRPFNRHLRSVIASYRLGALFFEYGAGLHHHAVRPAGYDFDLDEVNPSGMERWRSDYRSMSDERQMLAASIIWLYRAGKDNVWLRRVPCTWHAADAIDCMKSNDALADWARLFALYPGW